MANYDAKGNERVTLYDVNGNAVLVNADGSLTMTSESVTANLTLLASAAQTTTQTLADQTNATGRGVQVILDATVNAGGAGSITLEIDGKDPASGKYYSLLTGAAVVTVTTNVYRVYPGLTAAANATANDVLPRTWRVKVTANNANPVTYSVGACVLL
jgi:hypothetical protein